MQTRNPAKIGRSRHAQGQYFIVNKEKYIGNNPPIYRSSWEKDFMITCDMNSAILEWAAEPFSVPYQCPIDGKMKNYWVDFIIKYIDASGKIHTQVVEIKPYKQSVMEMAKSKRDKQTVMVNTAKWKYAEAYCKKNGIEFKVYTERELYR